MKSDQEDFDWNLVHDFLIGKYLLVEQQIKQLEEQKVRIENCRASINNKGANYGSLINFICIDSRFAISERAMNKKVKSLNIRRTITCDLSPPLLTT
ncbi:hypothetical protein [Vibrio marinisediminis]|nr:hypothetical protein [Vibrio marinisediminis]